LKLGRGRHDVQCTGGPELGARGNMCRPLQRPFFYCSASWHPTQCMCLKGATPRLLYDTTQVQRHVQHPRHTCWESHPHRHTNTHRHSCMYDSKASLGSVWTTQPMLRYNTSVCVSHVVWSSHAGNFALLQYTLQHAAQMRI
jgi:hypothetical protein